MEPPIQTEYLEMSKVRLEKYLVNVMFSLSLWWGNCLDLHGGGGEVGDLLLHPVGDAGVHGGPSGEDNVGVEVLPDVHVALHDGVVGGLVDTSSLHTKEGRLEKSLRAPEPLIANGDDLAIRKLVRFL